jgi:hypothetical protein
MFCQVTANETCASRDQAISRFCLAMILFSKLIVFKIV